MKQAGHSKLAIHSIADLQCEACCVVSSTRRKPVHGGSAAASMPQTVSDPTQQASLWAPQSVCYSGSDFWPVKIATQSPKLCKLFSHGCVKDGCHRESRGHLERYEQVHHELFPDRSLLFSCCHICQSQCILFSVPVTVERDASGNVTAMLPDKTAFRELLTDRGAVMADVSPDGSFVALLSTETSGVLNFRSTYIMDLDNGTLLDVTTGQTHNDQGDWPHWISDTELMYSNTNFCEQCALDPGCSTESRFSDLMLAQFSDDRTSVANTSFLFGAIDAAGFDTSACDASDSVFNTASASMIAFHSTIIDGKTTTHDGSCPWLEGLQGFNGEDYAGPKPVVWNMNALLGKQDVTETVNGNDYFLFDMESAGINSLAHLHFAPDQTILATEQNTVEFPLRACSIESVPLTNGLAACQNAGGKIILYNRIFGFEFTGTQYENLRRVDHPRKALFKHRHPQSLPDADRYYNPLSTGDNFQYKYAEFMQSSTMILATVMSHDTNDNNMAFSRLMFIDFMDPDLPYYFDLTGWLEDTFPERWSIGTASGFTGTAMP